MRKGLVSRSKGFLVLALVMVFLLGNTAIVKGGTRVGDKRQTTDTFTSLGGEYSIQYILGNYGVFSFKDITGSHIVGPVIAKERVYKTANDGISLAPIDDTISISDLANEIPSYVGNITKRKDGNLATFKMNFGHEVDKPRASLYTRYSDMNVWQDKDKYMLYTDNKANSFKNPNNGRWVDGSGEIFQNDNFIDFDRAKAEIKKESINMLNRPARVVSPNIKTGYLKIEAGYNYIIENASRLRVVDMQFPEGYDDGVKNIYDYPTFINFTGDTLATSGTEFEPIDLPGNYIGRYKLPNIEGESYQFFPEVLVNGKAFDGGVTQPGGHVDYGEKLNILWNMPNVKTLNGGYKMTKTGSSDILGHIIAPEVQFYNYIVDGAGTIKWAGGNMNGGAIVDSWYGGGREVHYWPYLDELEKPIFKDFYITGRKNLIGKPLEKNEFRFKLELTNALPQDGVVNKDFTEVSNNSDGTIYFPIIEFRKSGTYEFSIKEVTDTPIDKVTYDKSEYKLVVKVTENQGLTSLNISYDIFRVKDANGVDLDPMVKVEEIEFNNNYDYTLPETGGIGARGYLVLGMGLMLSSLAALAWKRL